MTTCPKCGEPTTNGLCGICADTAGEHIRGVVALQERIRELEDENERLRADKERLDWLGKNIVYQDMHVQGRVQAIIVLSNEFVTDHLREAIDKARTT